MRWPLSIALFHFFAKIGQFPMFLAVERFWRSWLQITVLHKARVHLALNRDVALVNFVQASRLTSWSWKTVAHAKQAGAGYVHRRTIESGKFTSLLAVQYNCKIALLRSWQMPE
jgi:hypothetical protein